MILSDVLTCTVPPLRVESSLLKNPIPPKANVLSPFHVHSPWNNPVSLCPAAPGPARGGRGSAVGRWRSGCGISLPRLPHRLGLPACGHAALPQLSGLTSHRLSHYLLTVSRSLSCRRSAAAGAGAGRSPLGYRRLEFRRGHVLSASHVHYMCMCMYLTAARYLTRRKIVCHQGQPSVLGPHVVPSTSEIRFLQREARSEVLGTA